MLTHLALRNFRSVLKARVAFSPTRLNVLVGANGSGKTNIVRALDFVSAINGGDLQAAVVGQGGQRSLLPKSVPAKSLWGVGTEIDYSIELPAPDGYPPSFRPPSGQHRLKFRTGPRNQLAVDRETLKFGQPLPVARALLAEQGQQADVQGIPKRSSLRFTRDRAGAIQLRAIPAISDRYVTEYVHWFGFDFVEQIGAAISSQQGFQDLLSQLQKRASVPRTEGTEGRTLAEVATFFFSLAQHASVFKRAAQNIKRFELHAEALRADQQPSGAHALTSDGANLPAVIRWMTSDKEREANWAAILATLRDIAPYVFDVQHDILKSGREYIEFMETKTGRPVESWDASDGTLRSLAILVAVETHPAHQTLVIEEPEKGLHPWGIRYLMDHIRDAIERRGVQVLLTTHSPQVLEAVSPAEVIVATRTHERGTELHLAKDVIGKGSVSPGDLGRLWVKGLLGGHPHEARP
jgi:predicted ATPase